MKPIKTLAFALTAFVLALLTACAGPAQTILADGSLAYRVECARGLNYCLEKAGKSCGGDGFVVIGRDGQTIAASEDDLEGSIARSAASASSQRMYFRCGTL
ncbi:MAG: hypothetical protein AAFZ58_11825 [Pseudomonadota bacterium]